MALHPDFWLQTPQKAPSFPIHANIFRTNKAIQYFRVPNLLISATEKCEPLFKLSALL
jgi:hypothetical protein